MKQLTVPQKRKLLTSLKKYRTKYLIGKYNELDESATRLMINSFLSDVLGFASLDEVKTEYMIRGTYADYIVQMKGKRYFIIEVKGMGIDLSEKHLRQATNYAANEGIEFALLTNGKQFDFYKILFSKPIESRKIFSTDLSEESSLKLAVENLQFLTRTLIQQRGLESLWQRCFALEPSNLSRLFYDKPVLAYIRRTLGRTCKSKFSDEEISAVITKVIEEKVSVSKIKRSRKVKKSKSSKKQLAINSPTNVSNTTGVTA